MPAALPNRRRVVGSACVGDARRAPARSGAETMAIPADDNTMRAPAESEADMWAGLVSAWKPEGM